MGGEVSEWKLWSEGVSDWNEKDEFEEVGEGREASVIPGSAY